jgi:hypothetical protein
MSTVTGAPGDETPQTPVPARNADLVSLPRCHRCNLSYMPTKSSSALRLTYCSFLCELGDLGFSMTGLEHMERASKKDEAPPEPVAAQP